MTDRLTELESTLRQIQADQGGEATFAGFVQAVVTDPEEQGHAEAQEYITVAPTISAYARSAQVEDFIRLKGNGRAVYQVTGKTLVDPPDNVEVELFSDPFSEAQCKSGDVWGGESVHIIQI